MFGENIKMAIQSVKAARFRSFLTMLGIIIGVSSVITVVSLGEGIKKQISSQSNSVGTDLITVRPGKLVTRDASDQITGINLLSLLSSSQLTEKDVASIRENPKVRLAVPLSIINGSASYKNQNFDEGFVMAAPNSLPEVIGHDVEFGSFYGENDEDIAVIGNGVAQELFKENVPLGKSFEIRGKKFVVGGVLERFEANPLSPEADFNKGVFIALEAGKTVSDSADLKIYEILVRPKSGEIDSVVSQLKTSLQKNHDGQEDFTVLKQDELVAVADSVLKIVNQAIAVVAGIALIVAGVGIMNVMLVSVTERTREIGIRKAVGATNSQIRLQFLTEAMVICGWGALSGIILSGIINIVFRIFTNLEPVLTWQSIVLSAAAAMLIGVVFGLIPAVKASRKDPIDALRGM